MYSPHLCVYGILKKSNNDDVYVKICFIKYIDQAMISWEEEASICLGSPCISYLCYEHIFMKYDSGFHRNGPCHDQTNPLLHFTNSCKLRV